MLERKAFVVGCGIVEHRRLPARVVSPVDLPPIGQRTGHLHHALDAGQASLLFLGSTSWAVWNLLVGAMVSGASIVLYDGHPSWPDGDALWRFMDDNDVAVFGCGAAFLISCMKDGLRPKDHAPLVKLRSILSTMVPTRAA